ncbi:MAG: protein translocase subunit SecD [candidate division Zixibacteria bacterium]|nr:protein translocase subunit SecD [candidate division Zixibacteria bacterium]
MNRFQMWRVIVTLILLVFGIFYSWPTVKYWTTPKAEIEHLEKTDPATLFKMRQKAMRLGLDLQGGMHVVLRVQLEKLDENGRKDAVERSEAIIRNRIDQFGVTEPLIQKSGDDRIIVDLPGFTDTKRAEKLIGEMARLEFKLQETFENAELLLSKIDKTLMEMDLSVEGGQIDNEAGDETPATTNDTESEKSDNGANVDVLADLLGEQSDSLNEIAMLDDDEADFPFSTYLEPVPGALGPQWNVETELVPNIKLLLSKPEVQKLIPADAEFAWAIHSEIFGAQRVTRLYLLKSRVQMSGEYLIDAIPRNNEFGKPVVDFSLTRKGGKIFGRVTGPNIGKPLAICLDGKVESAPRLNDRIKDKGTITLGAGTFQNARDLAIVLKAGALPTDVEIIESSVVGASLGNDSIERGTTASIIALALVLLFIAIYYRLSGVIADVALLFNLFFLLAAMAGLGATLTMPGIAGIILTIGIAVDANVLIFERIREELRTGKTVRASIDAGYERALVTIIDSHVTTLITAAILFIFGSGSIKGFAVSLFLGVLLSLYTAFFITKTIFDIRKGYKSISI